jgi:hypothetical protein
MNDRLIRIITALAVVAAAVVAGILPYQHAYELVRSHGESGARSGCSSRCELAPDWSHTAIRGARSMMAACVRRFGRRALLYSTAVRRARGVG